MKIRHADHREKIELQMTPMIDIVFLLLVFFIMTFKIVLPEGDFNIRMPLPSENTQPQPLETPTLRLRLAANDNGELASVQMGEKSFGNGPDAFAQLHQYLRSIVQDDGGPGAGDEPEVEIDADYNLRYDYTIRAITAISGYIENGDPHTLVEKIRFTPPKKP
ncbi:Biopolymer transport protein ExbD/TolR [Posidoniimonas polymericola]|uniref:Biopolymer transport protein ExbD/TolR n=1 Tax=Posidoniimonas polymericola TaxID=2528002 RepID=A0A5C5YHE5_9BACT|nr:biopolymer transporter ExbD [Posidoniimonas polymericola]TWT72762.1 Biopolymer transport protein ExbD/TolR [Posidoniimonas polymericola]